MKHIAILFLLFSLVMLVSCTDTSLSSTTTQLTTFNTTTLTTTEILTEPTTTVPSLTTKITTQLTTELPTTMLTTTEPTTFPSTEAPTTEVDNDPPLVIEMKNDSLKILQLTDLHLGNTSPTVAEQTLDLVTSLVNSDTYDLVVFTGDQTYAYTQAPYYYQQLAETMEACKTPWTFVFGNHDNAYNDYMDLINAIPNDTEYLYFKIGPELEGGGYGNFVIQFTKNNIPFYEVILMDSHTQREEFTPAEGRYDYLKAAQIEWYESKVSKSTVDNLLFMHIPLRQYFDASNYIGVFNEYICPQGVDTGMYDAILAYGKTRGLFVGHDHENDFYFTKDNILLGYGRVTGFGGYGSLERGGRVIEISNNLEIETYIILESELE